MDEQPEGKNDCSQFDERVKWRRFFILGTILVMSTNAIQGPRAII